MNTNLLPADGPDTIERAAEIIRSGGLLGIPTETVYGLGANGLDPDAVLKIFEAKGRPQDNPLILHVAGPEQVERFCHDIPDAARTLMERFWPGPLTLILPARDVVPRRTTAGLDTVGVRCPATAVTRGIIAAAGVPIAAPSANISGKPSPTTAAHVLHDMDGKIEAVVNVLNALDNTIDAKLAALEAAMQAQTLSLEGKLDLIKAAIEALPDYTSKLDALVAAIEALPDYSDKLDAVVNALDAMAAQVDALGGSQDAIAGKIADVTEAINDLIASVNSGNTDTAKALAAIVAMLEELKEAISSGGGGETPGDNSVVLDGETLTIVRAAIDKSDLEEDNFYDIYFFFSEENDKFIEIMANGQLHDGKTLDLTKKEDEHAGWFWSVEMRTPQILFQTFAKPGTDYPVFLSGTLLVKRIGTGTEFEVTLKDGKVKGYGTFGDGLEHTISLNYKGTLDFGEF